MNHCGVPLSAVSGDRISGNTTPERPMLARAASVTGKYTIDAATVSFTVIEAVSITI
jgi:hypothetical protein